MLKLLTAPTDVPVALADAKTHLRVDVSDDDTLITSMLWAATGWAEHKLGRALMPQAWQLVLDSFFDETVYSEPVPLTVDLIRGPGFNSGARALNLSRPPVTGVTSVKYLDTTGTQQTMPSSDYALVNVSEYGARLVPAYGKSWPAAQPFADAVQVTFACGYANAAAVPEPIKQWIRLQVGSLYENRESWTVGRTAVMNENAFVDRLLDRYRVFTV